MKPLAAALAGLVLSGCIGYHIGPAKPNYLRDVHTIAIPTFENKTLMPRIEVLVTDTVVEAVSGSPHLEFEDIGSVKLKGFDEPRELCRVYQREPA